MISVALAILTTVFFVNLKDYMKPEITAKEYFKAFMAGDYEKAYDLPMTLQVKI